jgi:hypothetical protein
VPLADTMLAYEGLLTNGWSWRESSTGVFDDFLRLADVPDTAMLAEEACSKVVAFARKWGPLWLCRTPIHTEDCYWRPDISVLSWTSNNPRDIPPEWLRYQKKNHCQWIPMEEVDVFLQKARQVKTLFEAIVQLQNGDSVAKSLWRVIGIHEARASALATASREEQLMMLCTVLRIHLYWCSEFRVGLGWDHGPKLKIVPPPGFIHVVLLTLAQLLCQARGVYQCDECGNFYIRTGKRPQTGKRNFCRQCGSTASKRQWAQRKRYEAQTDDLQAEA